MKNGKILNALFIGFLAGISFVGIAALLYRKNGWGLIAILLPLFLIYRLAQKNKKEKRQD